MQDDLASLTSELKQSLDALAEKVIEFEDKLVDFSCRVNCVMEIPGVPVRVLAFTRQQQGDWKLTIDGKAMESCKIIDKILIAKNLEAFLVKYTEEVKKVTLEAKAAIKDIENAKRIIQ